MKITFVTIESLMMSVLDPAPTPDDEDFIAEENYSTLQSLLSTQTEEEGDSIKVMLLFQNKINGLF